MKLVKKNFICPYCFSKKDLYKIQFRCQNSPADCAPEVDYVYANFRGIAPVPMNKVFDIPAPKNYFEKIKSWRLPKVVKCPHCSEPSSIRICPGCHSELPYTIGDFNDMIISVIGAKESGKSHYIAVLIHTIENIIGKLFNVNLQNLDDNTSKKYREEFYNPIFINQEVIPETKGARGNYSTKMPMIFSLSFMIKRLFGKFRISNVTTISFFDTAGEDLNSQEILRTENKYIYNSAGIILLVDPLQIEGVRNQLSLKGVNLPNINTETEDIIPRIAKLIRTALQLPVDQLIEIPIAVALTKIDALDTLIDSGSILFGSGKHKGHFNLKDSTTVNSEVESLITEWAGFHLIQEVKHNFKNYSFFGLSALGSNPHGSGKISKLRPVRVEDPFLWLLYKNHIINDGTLLNSIINYIYRLKIKLIKNRLTLFFTFIAAMIIMGLTTVAILAAPFIAGLISSPVNRELDPEIPVRSISYRELAGNYYGIITDVNKTNSTIYVIIKQNPFDSTQFVSYIKYDIKKAGINSSIIFNRDSMQVVDGVLGAGNVLVDSAGRKVFIISDSDNTLKWKIEK